MMNVYKSAGPEVRNRRDAPAFPLNRKNQPRAFDAVAYAAVLEVLG
jgi:hypothetical protein